MFLTFLFFFFFFVQPPRKVCIANRNIGQKFVFLENKYISVILAFVVCSSKLVTSAVGISLPLISLINTLQSRDGGSSSVIERVFFAPFMTT